MVGDYKGRLQKAMADAKMHPQALADLLGVSLQSVRKVLAGGSAAFSVANHFEACKVLAVDPGWLATGDGDMRSGLTWPFGDDLSPETFFALDHQEVQPAIDVLVSAAKRKALMTKLGAPPPAEDARVGEFIDPAPRHELNSGFGELMTTEAAKAKRYKPKQIELPPHLTGKKAGKGRKEG